MPIVLTHSDSSYAVVAKSNSRSPVSHPCRVGRGENTRFDTACRINNKATLHKTHTITLSFNSPPPPNQLDSSLPATFLPYGNGT